MVSRSNIEYLISELAKFSAIPKELGTSRHSYTKEYREAINFLKEHMEKEGLAVREDGLGIVYARLEGTNPEEKVVMTGSHLDTVREGGNYDGIAGVVCGLEAMLAIKESGAEIKKPIELVVMTEEEGCRFNLALFSSRAIIGNLEEDELHTTFDPDGMSIYEAILADGLSGDYKASMRDDISSVLELHIEQGPVLENKGMDLGAVTSIVALTGFSISVHGLAGHAGATPMIGRQDAMVAAADCMVKLEKMIKDFGNDAVLTVGRLEIKPGSFNVIPYQVDFNIDLRCPSDELLAEAADKVLALIHETVAEHGCTASHVELFRKSGAKMNEEMMESIIKYSDELGYKSCRLPSGAGHDSQVFAKKFDTAMIFIPCLGGRSHCKEEFSTTEQLAKGADVIEKMLLELANK